MTAAVELSDVGVRLHGQTVLEKIDLRLESGQFYLLIGPNGGGKTTLLRTMMGLVEPNSGSVRVFGEAANTNTHRIGYVPQQSPADPQFPITAGEVVEMAWAWSEAAADDTWTQRRDQLRDALELAPFWERRFGRLSGGQQRRVLVARALMQDPELLLLDEPTAGVDPGQVKAFYDLISDRPDRTILLATHDLSVVSKRVDAVACINRTLTVHQGHSVDAAMLHTLYGDGVEPMVHGHVHVLAHDDHAKG